MKRLLVSLLVLASLGACERKAKEPDAAPSRVEGDVVIFPKGSPQVSSFTVEPVRRQDGERLVLTGRLVWNEDTTVRVFSPVSGRVQAIRADLGRRVPAGEVLATIVSPDFGQAQSDAVRASADLSTAQRTLERVRVLYEKGAAARKEVEQAEADSNRARAEAERTRGRLALWGGDGTKPGIVDQDFRLRSSIAGVIVERNLNPGQEVRPDATTPLFVVSDPSRLWVLLDVTERDLPSVQPGAPLTIRTSAYPDRTFSGTLRVIGSSLDPSTRTARARGLVDNREGLLKAEMYVTVDLVRRSSANQIVLPARAVLQAGTEHVVFVEDTPGRYRRVLVSVGREQEGMVPILSGLDSSARVVTEGTLLLEAAWSARGSA